jgi:outer membrane immunogenic protein
VSASAADLPRKAPAYVPPAPLPYNWTGFYLGSNAGVGGGVEWAFYNNWGAKLEYLYINFGETDGTGGHGVRWRQRKLTDNIVRVGVNYKFF